MNVLISACLLGVGCRYDGISKKYDGIENLIGKYNLIPVCPEIMGGLKTPRNPAEIVGDRVVCDNSDDVTAQYLKGARETLRLAKMFSCEFAILKANSPSCGNSKIYDGTFSHRLIDGMGVTAKLLTENGIKVINENEISEL
ncbi:MAG: DUF523 domain-containing protein [Clostridia bacterium]|nr:DUF523 domain-containing protein [Clostridia bacterium]